MTGKYKRSVAEAMKYKSNKSEEGRIPGQPAVSNRDLFSEDMATCIYTQQTKNTSTRTMTQQPQDNYGVDSQRSKILILSRHAFLS